MAPVKRITDLTSYATVLPYASELFGVYQPLLGWKSQRIEARFKQGYENDRRSLLDRLKREFTGIVDIQYVDGQQVTIQISPGILAGGKKRSFDSVVLDNTLASLPTFTVAGSELGDDIVTAEVGLEAQVGQGFSLFAGGGGHWRSNNSGFQGNVGARVVF